MERLRHQDSSLVRRQGASRNASIDSPPLIGVPLRVCPCPVVLGPGLAVVGFNMVQGAGPPLTAGNAGSRDWRGDSKSKLVIPISRSWRLLDLEGSRCRKRDDSRRLHQGPKANGPLLSCWPSRFSDDRGAVKVSLGLAGRKRLPAWRHHSGPMAALENRGIPSSRALSCLGSGGHQGAHGSDFGPAAQCARSRPSLVFLAFVTPQVPRSRVLCRFPSDPRDDFSPRPSQSQSPTRHRVADS